MDSILALRYPPYTRTSLLAARASLPLVLLADALSPSPRSLLAKKLKMLVLFTGATIRRDSRYGAGFLAKLFAVIAAVFAIRAKL